MLQLTGSPASRELRASRAYVVRKKPLYHNCQLRSPDGQLLCTCDIKKAKWYLDKGLGSMWPVVLALSSSSSSAAVASFYYYYYLCFYRAVQRTSRSTASPRRTYPTTANSSRT